MSLQLRGEGSLGGEGGLEEKGPGGRLSARSALGYRGGRAPKSVVTGKSRGPGTMRVHSPAPAGAQNGDSSDSSDGSNGAHAQGAALDMPGVLRQLGSRAGMRLLLARPASARSACAAATGSDPEVLPRNPPGAASHRSLGALREWKVKLSCRFQRHHTNGPEHGLPARSWGLRIPLRLRGRCPVTRTARLEGGSDSGGASDTRVPTGRVGKLRHAERFSDFLKLTAGDS